MQSFSILHEAALKVLESFQELEVERMHVTAQFSELLSPQGLSAQEPSSSVDELNYSTQAMQPKSQFSSGYSAHKASTPGSLVAQFDELNYSTQAMQPKSQFSSGYSTHKASTPRSPTAQFEEFNCSAQAIHPKS